MSTTLVLLGGAAAITLFVALIKFVEFCRGIQHMKKLTKDVPQPTAYPLIGHFHHFAVDPRNIYDTLMEIFKDKSSACLWLGHVCVYFVMDPIDMEAVMANPKFNNKSLLYHSTKKMIGDGLAILDGQVYKRHRKAMTPSLHLDILGGFVEIFDAESRAFAYSLGKHADSGEVFDVKPLCGYCANTAVCRTVFSSSVSDDEVQREHFVQAIMPGQELLMYRVWRPWLLNDWVYSFHSQYPLYRKTTDIADTFVKTVIQKKKSELAANGGQLQKGKRVAFLDHMLSSAEGAALSTDELFEEVKTITVIASGSSMDALAFLCYTMALKPDMQRKLQQEVDDIFGGDDSRPITFTDLPHLQFTERFIKETLRYFPVLPMFGRRCEEDFKLPSGNTIPKGCQVLFFLPNTYMNPEHFPDPKKFDPDRFLPENSRTRHPFSYVPFSAGARNCIGQRYAMMFLKTVVANLVRRIEFLPAPDSHTQLEDVKLKMDLTLSVRDEANIRVRRRVHAS